MLWGAAAAYAQQPSPAPPAAKPTAKPAAEPAGKPGIEPAGKPATSSPRAAAPEAAPDTAKAAADTTKVDAATARRRRLAADTVKAPLAQAEMPVEPGSTWRWRGEELRAAGAVTLSDLLARIPGATAFRANWIPAPQFVAYNGDVGRVRVFRDGVELDAIDPRNGQVLDLALVSLWQFEEVGVERAPGELRVHLRSWRVDRTIPLTRTEVITGSENTNLYRGFFGRRFHNGAAVQLAAQQMSTTSPRTGGDGTSLQVFARVGWAWRRLSVDGVWHRASLDRAATIRFPLAADLTNENGTPAFKGNYGAGYGRIAWGDPDAKGAPWVQVIASTQMIAENSKVSETTSLTIPTAAPKDTVDTATSRAQYVVAAGASRWGVRGSVAARLRAWQGRTSVSPSLRLGYDWRFVSLAGFAESRGADSTQRLDLTARIAPWRWLVLSGAHGSYTPTSPITGGPKFSASRVELESTLFGVTVSGGLLTRGLTTVAAPVAIDSSLVRVGTGEVKGVAFAVRTGLWRELSLDVSGVRWESSGVYRPQMEIRSMLFVDTSFPNRFPRNNFHLFASATYNHRTPMFFPTNDGKVGLTTGPVDAIGARLEIRIESGTVFFQTENMVGKIYDTAPGYMMPRRLQYYGLRWDFWN